jgi:hypothetical protein
VDILAKYEEYAKEGTDAPTKYHKFAAASMLGCLMGRRLWYRHGHAIIFPHLWVCLLGPSTWMKKSTAIGIAEGVIQKADPELLLTTKITLEKLYQVLSKRNWGIMCYKEFGAMLAMMRREFNTELMATITDWYDAPPQTKYQKVGGDGAEVVVRRPALSLLVASTMDWLVEAAKSRDIAGGFYPRWLYCHAETSDVPDKPRPADPSYSKREAILYAIKNEVCGNHNVEAFDQDDSLQGRMMFDHKAGQEYDRIYSTWKADYGRDGLMGGFSGRGLVHIIKLAMIHAMGERRSVSMTVNDIAYAYDLVTSSMRDIKQICDMEVSDSKTGSEVNAIRKLIKKAGASGLTKRELLRRGPLKLSNQLMPILESLQAQAYITVLPGKRADSQIYMTTEQDEAPKKPMTVQVTVPEVSSSVTPSSGQSNSFIEAPYGL